MKEDIVADVVKFRNFCRGKIPVSDLKVGNFANVNGSIIYRFDIASSRNFWYDLTGCFTIEKHNHKVMGDWWVSLGDDTESRRSTYSYMVELIEKPKKKHVDNAIAMLKKDAKEHRVTGLQYLENYTILKDYLKAYGKKKTNV